MGRTLLTSARLQTAINPTSTANLYRPLFTQKFFHNTAKMSEDHKGVHNLKNKEQFEEVMAVKDSLMVVDCFATWCGPCKVIAPQVVKFSEKYPRASTSSTSTKPPTLQVTSVSAPCLPSSFSRTEPRSPRSLAPTPRLSRPLSRTTSMHRAHNRSRPANTDDRIQHQTRLGH